MLVGYFGDNLELTVRGVVYIIITQYLLWTSAMILCNAHDNFAVSPHATTQ